MFFIKENNISDFLNTMMNAPALKKLNPSTKSSLLDTFKKFNKNNYIDQPTDIINFMNYSSNEKFSELLFTQYGISQKYYNKLNKTFKKVLLYYLENIYQYKGTIKTLEFFSDIFRTVLGDMNFYRVIVVKKIDPENPENYLITYELEPLIINSSDVLTHFDEKISLTGKHLTALSQYQNSNEKFSVFPVKTNLIYIQFNSAQSVIDNKDTFNLAVRIYALTTLNTKTIRFVNFYNSTFEIPGSDIETIIKYIIFRRNNFLYGNYSFSYKKYKTGIPIILSSEYISIVEDFLHEYKSLNYSDLKEMNNFKRRWNMFTKQFITTKKLYNDNIELEQYVIDNMPDIKNIIDGFKSDQDYEQFLLDLYDRIIAKVNINDNYLIMYINFIILSCISNKSFLDQFFIPLYNIFSKYLFPIELDFINKIEDKYSVKDKFESFGTFDKQACSLTLNGFMSKVSQTPDQIKICLIKKNEDQCSLSDQCTFLVKPFQRDKLKYSNFIRFDINSRFFTKNYSEDLKEITVLSNQEDKNYSEDLKEITILSNQEDKNYSEDLKEITIMTKYKKLNKFNERIKFDINTEVNDQNTISDQNTLELIRFNYTSKIGDLDLYLIFKNEQYRKQSSYEQNSYYKFTSINDEIYFNFYNFF
jgi:hypothetical protein